ncbi:Ribonuclease H2 subunit A [Echinococcus granulosus]|uniref:Ribonuclease n=1 Tax=Echinococcus granulosus TaxID=6210 RepID=W6VCG3_ECHGR|nr:Ribonuclease H2 subunit A [Echinococcus granulosus]EUB64569.1 Ribonuclease H2 subunit A [Echinococcus granulosus]
MLAMRLDEEAANANVVNPAEEEEDVVRVEDNDDSPSPSPWACRYQSSLSACLAEGGASLINSSIDLLSEANRLAPCMLGIDEAGRGPVLGPMLYACAVAPLGKNPALKEMGLAVGSDSKQLTEGKREELLKQMLNEGDWIAYTIHAISPMEITEKMLSSQKISLNVISQNAAIGLIRSAINQGVNLKEVYVDTVGKAGVYQAYLSSIFPELKIVVESKADATYPIVSAASIYAKAQAGSNGLHQIQSPYETSSRTPSEAVQVPLITCEDPVWFSGYVQYRGYSGAFLRVADRTYCIYTPGTRIWFMAIVALVVNHILVEQGIGVTRDRLLSRWPKEGRGPVSPGTPIGSGYPGGEMEVLHTASKMASNLPLHLDSAVFRRITNDPATKQYLQICMDPILGFPPLVRSSWATAQTLLGERGVRVVWLDEAGWSSTHTAPKDMLFHCRKLPVFVLFPSLIMREPTIRMVRVVEVVNMTPHCLAFLPIYCYEREDEMEAKEEATKCRGRKRQSDGSAKISHSFKATVSPFHTVHHRQPFFVAAGLSPVERL